MREAFFNDPEDVQWLKETHLKDYDLAFKSFVLVGNEDCPEQIILYLASDPEHIAHPAYKFAYNPETQKQEQTL